MRKPAPAILVVALCLQCILAGACGPAITTPRPPAPEPERIHVTITPLAGQDAWSVTYDLAPATRQLTFLRRIGPFREKHWKVVTPGLQIVARDDEEAVVGSEPFRRVELTFPSLYSADGKDYQPIVRYSDGGQLFYTGHLLAAPDGVPREPAPTVPFTLIPPDPAGTVVVRGQDIHGARAEWRDDSEDGTYVYLGAARPVVEARFIAVMDPALPEWMRARTIDLLPRILDLYAKRTATPLTVKPVLFMPYRAPGGGAAHAGGTLPGAVLLSFEGAGWMKATPALDQELAAFLSHELAHLWNRRMYRPVLGPSWMHEGGAEAFSARALLRLGIIDRAELAARHRAALDECREATMGVTLAESEGLMHGKSAYRCGLLLALVTELGTRGTSDIFGFWGQLFSRARAAKGRYSEDMYLTLLGERASSPALLPIVRAIVHDRAPDPTASWAAALRLVGVSVDEKADDSEPGYQQKWGLGLLRDLMKADCHGEASLKRRPTHVILEGLPTCKHLSSDVAVDQIGGHKILDEGAAAYDAAYASCVAEGAVTLGLLGAGGQAGGQMKIPCPGLRQRPPLLRLGEIPLPAPAPY